MPKRYVNKVFLELSSQKQKLVVNFILSLWRTWTRSEIELKYSERHDDWRRPYDTEDSKLLFKRMESLCIPSSTSLDDRTELVHGELYREMKKKKLYSGEI